MFRVLIVDDDINDRTGLEKFINWKSLMVGEVYTAENGEQGYEMAIKLKPDLLIADVAMPKLNGLEMASKLREEMPDIKFIFVSCFDEPMYLKSAIQFNSYGYIQKPIDLDEIENTIKKVLDVRTAEIHRDEELAYMENKLDLYKEGYKKQYLRDLILGNIHFDNNTDVTEIGLEIIDYYAVAYFKIKGNEKNKILWDYDDVYRLENYLNDNLGIRNVSMVNGCLNCVVVIYLDDVKDDDLIAKAIEPIELCREKIKRELNIDTFCFLSHMSNDYSEIHDLYLSLENMASDNITGESDKLIVADEVDVLGTNLDFNMECLKAELKRIVGLSSDENIETAVEGIFNKFNIENMPNKKQFVYLFRVMLEMIVSEFGEQSENVIMLSDKYTADLPDIQKWCIATLRECKMRISESNCEKVDARIQTMKDFIEKNYAKIDKLAMVADEVMLSINHASYIFKQQTGHTMFDYLIMVRLEKAKQLLDETYDKVYEISEKVGYKSPTYFTALFKQYTNMSPKDYRFRNK